MKRLSKKEKILKTKLEQMKENTLNRFDHEDICDWIIRMLEENFSLKEIESFDAWKTYVYVDVVLEESNWTSYQGASMTTKNYNVVFNYLDKTFKTSFEDTKGCW
jgi:hypothetical protein